MLFFVVSCLLLAIVSCNVGPKTSTMLIPRTQNIDNVMGEKKGNSIELTFWVYTYDDPDEEDKGIAEINFDTTLTLNGVDDGSTIYWCPLIYKKAGIKTNYDCGICTHTLNKTNAAILEPTDVDLDHRQALWEVRDSWFPDIVPYVQDPIAHQYIKDGMDSKYFDYEWREEMDFTTELIPNTEIVKLACPVKRLMNTEDYDDAKVEITLKYYVKGFYLVVGPEDSQGNRKYVYGSGEKLAIEILDESLMGLASWLPLLGLVGTLLFV